MIHEDLDGILSDLREKHKRDRLSAPKESPAEVFAREIAGLSGKESENVRLDGAMKAAAKMFGLTPDDLSEDDWAASVMIVQAVERKNGRKRRRKW